MKYNLITLAIILQLLFLLFGCSKELYTRDTLSNTNRINSLLSDITQRKQARNYKNLDELNYIASYIHSDFSKYADTVYYQPYRVNGVEYKNVIAVFGSKNPKTIVVGAHYDVCGEQQGADDNESGVVGLLELGRLLKDKELKNRIELVASTLEEPPYFRTEYMGSYIHAQSLKDNKADVA